MTIENKLKQLEKACAQSRRMNYLLLLGIAALAFMGFQKNQELEHLKVKSISIIGENGNTIGQIKQGWNGGYIEIMDSTGRTAFEGGSLYSGGYLNVFNNRGKKTIWLTQMQDGGGYVGVKNTDEKDVAGIGVSGNGPGYFYICDQNGNTRNYQSTFENGNGYSVLYNNQGKLTVKLSAKDDNSNGGSLGIYSSSNYLRSYLGVDNNSCGYGLFYNNYGNSTISLRAYSGLFVNNWSGYNRIRLSVTDNDAGYINMYNRNGNRNIYLGNRSNSNDGILYTSDGYNATGTFPR